MNMYNHYNVLSTIIIIPLSLAESESNRVIYFNLVWKNKKSMLCVQRVLLLPSLEPKVQINYVEALVFLGF